ncbi:GspH/FimT family protein [Oceanisphaera avium]|nr:GspH/FimT family protein [Oceanisphaera avium]
MRMTQRGLSLLELLISLALVSLLASLALPSFQRIAEQARLRAAGNMLYHHLQQARSEAIKRNTAITLCFSDSGTLNWQYKIVELAHVSHCDGLVLNNIQQASSIEFPNLILTANYPSPYLIFKPRRVSLLAGNITLTQGEHQLEVLTWNNGLIRLCSASAMAGVTPC